MRSAFLSLGVCSLLAACQGETGIIIAVAGPSVEELEFQVGVEHDPDVWMLDHEASGQRRNVRGRNLRSSPYEMLLREEDEAGSPLRVRVLVLGLTEGKPTHYDVTEPPQPFIREEVVRRHLFLDPLGDSASVTKVGQCFRIWRRSGDKSESWQLVTADDRDCDGSSAQGQPPDCNDLDSTVHPGATELCDGKDNNCDGKYAPSTQDCYAMFGTACRRGTRACGDAQGSGLGPTCTVKDGDPIVPTSYCQAYSQCMDASDPLGCTEHNLEPQFKVDCTAERTDAGMCGGSLPLQPPIATTTCRWSLASTGGFSVGLSDGQSAPVSAITLCEAKLVLEKGSAPGGGSVLLDFIGDAEGVTIGASINVEKVAACSAVPFKCAPP
jgi:hypothetical protein